MAFATDTYQLEKLGVKFWVTIPGDILRVVTHVPPYGQRIHFATDGTNVAEDLQIIFAYVADVLNGYADSNVLPDRYWDAKEGKRGLRIWSN